MSRRTPFVLIALAVSALLVWYVVYTQQAVAELRRAAQVQGKVTATIFSALADTSSGESALVDALFTLVQQVRESGVPLVWIDPSGAVADTANLPFRTAPDSVALRAYIAELDAQGEPISSTGAGTIYVGDSRLVRGLATIPLVQAGAIGLLLLLGLWGLRERGRAEREKVWAGMARESAHQLGTPLSSLAGWVELLQDDPERRRTRQTGHSQHDAGPDPSRPGGASL
jgi:signal transduction histidine kinase